MVSKKIAERQGARSTNASSTAATQCHRHWTRWGRIEGRASVHTLGILKTSTVTRRSLGVLIERRGDAVRSPYPCSKVSYNAIGAPWAHTRVVVQMPWSWSGDCTAFLKMSLRHQRSGNAVKALCMPCERRGPAVKAQ